MGMEFGVDDLRLIRIYSGEGRSGRCVCGCRWDQHHLGIAVISEYIEATGEAYIPQECDHYGVNETGGMKFNEQTGKWEDHCYGYRDEMLPDEHN